MANSDQDLELNLNPASVVAGLQAINKAFAAMEKGGVGSSEKLSSAIDSFSRRIVTATDKAAQSQARYVRSIEQQAAAYGRSGVDKLLAQRDSIIKRLGDEEKLVQRVTAAYAKMIEVEKRRGGKKGGGYEDSPEQTLEFFSRSVRDIYVGRPALASVALGRAVNNLSGLPFIIAGVTTAIAVLGAASLSSAVSLGRLAEETENVKLRTGFTTKEVAQFGFAARAVGQDIDVFERGMRGLTAAVEDQSSAGDKARGWLLKFGVDIRAVREGTATPAEVFKQIATGLEQLPVGFQRTAAQMDIFKRIGIELIPVMEGLNSNIRVSQNQDWGFGDAAQKRLLGVDQQFDELKEAWKDFKEKIIQDTLAIPVIFVLKSVLRGPGETTGINDYSTLAMDALRRKMGLPEEQTLTNDARMGIGRSPQYPASESAIKAAQLGIDQRNAASAVSGYFSSQGTAGQLKLAELELSNRGRVQSSVSSVEDVAKIRSQEKVVESLKEQLRLEERSKSINEDIAKLKLSVAETLSMGYMTPIEKQIRDKIAGGASASQAAQYRSIADPLAYRQRTDYQNTSLRSYIAAIERGDTREFDEGASMSAHQAMAARTLAERTAAASRAMSRSVQGVSEADSRSRQGSAESLLNLYGIVSPDTAQTRQTMAGVRAGIDTRRQVEEFEAKRVRALEDYSDRQDIINSQAYDNETDRANNLQSLKLSHENELSALKTGHETDLAAIQARYMEANAQEYRRQLDSIKQEASSLYTTLLTHPSKFGAELGSTIRGAATKAIVNPLSEMTARYLQPLIFGGGGGGMSDIRLVNGAMPVYITGGGALGGSSGGAAGALGSLGGFGLPGAPGGTSGFSGPVSGLGGLSGLSSLPGLGGSGGILSKFGVGGGLGAAIGLGGGMLGLQGAFKLGQRGGLGGGLGAGALGAFSGMLGFGGLMAMFPALAAAGPAGWIAAAGIGAAIGLSGLLFKSPKAKAKQYVKRDYGISISDSMADQIVQLAKSKYGGDVSIATRDPDVRNMLMLYASGTGQSAQGAMSSMTPRGAGLVESGGSLSQQSSYVYGQQYSFQSSLPIYGGGGGGTYPNMGSGSSPMVFNISGDNVGKFFDGQIFSPEATQAKLSRSLSASNGRVQNALTYSEPGAVVS